MALRVLDLFCGLGGATQAFRDAGHDVLGIDNNPDLEPDMVADVRDLDAEDLLDRGPWDLVWASPPCTTFSVMTISVYHDANGHPDHPLTHERLALIHDTLALIQRLDPRAWILENPTGMLRRQDFMHRFDRETVTYCQYGHFLRKSTDLWGGFPPTLDLEKPCDTGSSCHASSPRDLTNSGDRPARADPSEWDCDAWKASTGKMREAWKRNSRNILPKDPERSALRALVPYELSEDLCEAMERFDGHWSEHSEREQTQQQRLREIQ